MIERHVEYLLDTHPRKLTSTEREALRPQLEAFVELLAELNISLQDLEFLNDAPPQSHDTSH